MGINSILFGVKNIHDFLEAEVGIKVFGRSVGRFRLRAALFAVIQQILALDRLHRNRKAITVTLISSVMVSRRK